MKEKVSYILDKTVTVLILIPIAVLIVGAVLVGTLKDGEPLGYIGAALVILAAVLPFITIESFSIAVLLAALAVIVVSLLVFVIGFYGLKQLSGIYNDAYHRYQDYYEMNKEERNHFARRFNECDPETVEREMAEYLAERAKKQKNGSGNQ